METVAQIEEMIADFKKRLENTKDQDDINYYNEMIDYWETELEHKKDRS